MDEGGRTSAVRDLLKRAGLPAAFAGQEADDGVQRVTMDEFRQIIGAKARVRRDG
jgi:hypothetical protein